LSISSSSLHDVFPILSPILLLPPLVVIILVAKRVPAIPGIFVGVILGMIFAPIFQGANFGDILSSSYSGYVSQTGILALDELIRSEEHTSELQSRENI